MKRTIMILSCMAGIAIAAESELPAPEKLAIEPAGTEKSAVQMLDSIIKGNQSLSVKIGHPLLPGKIRSWQDRGIIRYPTKLMTWTVFKKDIQQLGFLLESLRAQDPQSNQYYHIDALRNNHALYKELATLEKGLAQYERKIEFTQPIKLAKESLESLQKLIDIYASLFYQQKILSRINETLKAFDEKAQKIRKEQDDLQKTAQKKDSRFTLHDSYEQTDQEDVEYDATLSESESFDYDLESLGFGEDFIASFFE